jgi:hypothetical protein
MGQLKPGATYIYEKADGVTYAREFGSTDRTIVGMDQKTRAAIDEIRENQMWHDIRQKAKDNITLQKALDRAIMIYNLSKE